MKALTKWAALCAALCAAVACSVNPFGAAQGGVNDALGQIGGVAGFTGYSAKIEGGQTNADGTVLKASFVTDIYFNADKTKAKGGVSAVYDGTMDDNGTKVAFNNEVATKFATGYDVTEITVPADYTIKDNDGAAVTTADLGEGYKFYQLKQTANKMWTSKKAGGNETWADDTLQTETNYVRIADPKLYKISARTDTVGKTITLNINPKALKDGDSYTYTKK